LLIISPQVNPRLNAAMYAAMAAKTRSLYEEDAINRELKSAISLWSTSIERDLTIARQEIVATPDTTNPTVRILLTLNHD
jgi:hypothetical protein